MIGAPYLLLAKIAAIGVILAGVALGAYQQGKKAVQADWDRDSAEMKAAQLELVQEHSRQMAEEWARQMAVNKNVSQEHERKLDEIGKKYATELERVKRSGGLRVPGSICAGASSAAAETAGNGGSNEASPGTVALPEQTTTSLFELAREADQVTEQLRACQSWIKQNGFYH